MTINITTPALLFPAISLLLLAYTNRFLVIAQLIRTLHSQLDETNKALMKEQIIHLRKRISYIRSMQATGVLAFICCTLTMGMMLVQLDQIAYWLFALSLLLLLISLIFSLIEILHSGQALNLQLKNLEK